MVQRTLCEAFSGSVLFWSKWLSISNWNLEFWKCKSSFWLCSFSSVPGPINIHLIFFLSFMNFFILDKLGKEWHHILLNQQMYWLMYLFFGKQLNYRSKMSLLSTSGQFWNLQGECWVSNHRCETARVIRWIPHSRSYSKTSGLHSLMHTHTNTSSVPTPFIQESFSTPMCILGTIIKIYLTINMHIYFWAYYSVSLDIHNFIFM